MRRPDQNHSNATTSSNSSNGENTTATRFPRKQKEVLDILFCFDSNGKHINRKKLWKLNGSDYRTCYTLQQISDHLKKLPYKDINHIFISVATNDLDHKDHDQVFGEMELLIDEIRGKYPGIKIGINELLPRKDNKNDEVKDLNRLLKNFAEMNADITFAHQLGIDQGTLSDNKHLDPSKVPVYAKNIMNGLLKVYGISCKSELFHPSVGHSGDKGNNFAPKQDGRSIQHKMQTLANYGPIDAPPLPSQYVQPPQKEAHERNSNEMICNALMQFNSIMMKCMQR